MRWTGGGANSWHSAYGSLRNAKHPNRLPCLNCKNASLVGLTMNTNDALSILQNNRERIKSPCKKFITHYEYE